MKKITTDNFIDGLQLECTTSLRRQLRIQNYLRAFDGPRNHIPQSPWTQPHIKGWPSRGKTDVEQIWVVECLRELRQIFYWLNLKYTCYTHTYRTLLRWRCPKMTTRVFWLSNVKMTCRPCNWNVVRKKLMQCLLHQLSSTNGKGPKTILRTYWKIGSEKLYLDIMSFVHRESRW